MALSKEAEEAMKALGHKIEDVEGGDVDETAAGSDQQVAPGSDQAIDGSGSDQTSENLGSDQVAEKVEEKPKDDKNWQSSYDQSQLALKERDSELLKSEAEKQALMNLLGNQQQVQPKIEPQKEDKEPQLSDFIKLDEYFSEDALNPGTVSGMAYQTFNKATISFENKKSLVEYEKSQAEKQANEMAQRQATALCEARPEFKNPLTGQPDMVKITNFITSISNSDDVNLWVKLHELTKAKTSNSQSSQVTVGKRADNVLAVGALSSTETDKKPLSKTAEGMKIFGDTFEYLEGVELE